MYVLTLILFGKLLVWQNGERMIRISYLEAMIRMNCNLYTFCNTIEISNVCEFLTRSNVRDRSIRLHQGTMFDCEHVKVCIKSSLP